MQSAPDHVGDWQECLGPGGVWEQGEGGAGGAIAGGRDKLGHRSWDDGSVCGVEGRGQYCSTHRRGAGRPLYDRPAANARPADS
jgi:hypothetical protein